MRHPENSQVSDVAIVGAGPVGLETAAMLMEQGFRVTVFEQGAIGNAVREWGHVRLFTPFQMNRSDLTCRLVGRGAPGDEALLTGSEFAAQWLTPLARVLSESTGVSIREHHRIASVSRDSLRKGERIGQSSRRDSPFRLLVEDLSDTRRESTHRAKILIDSSGFLSRHCWIGAGGMPCPGERDLLRPRDYKIPDIDGMDRDRFSNRNTLVIGSGCSAATAVAACARLQKSEPQTSVTWITKGSSPTPIAPIENDPLPGRADLIARVNTLAADGDARINWLPGRLVEDIQKRGEDHQYAVTLRHPDTQQTIVVKADNVVALPGYRPDISAFEELQIHRCYATDGPIQLAAHLLGKGAGDCMKQTAVGVDLLQSPEPDFYVLGAASYGRNSSFLLRAGIEQAEAVARHLAQQRSKA